MEQNAASDRKQKAGQTGEQHLAGTGSLEGKVALVTGAGRGIGRSIARKLAQEGALVIVNYNGSEQSAREVQAEIRQAGGAAELCRCDVTDAGAVEAMLKAVIDRYQRLDILVNNAGITRDNLILNMSEADFDAVIATNLKGTFLTMKYAARWMIRQRSGRIINLSSVSGILGNAGQVNYAASKAGVIGMTKTMARELASRGITVNAVAPGFVETEMTAGLSQAQRAAAAARIGLQRFGRPEEIAETVSFLASEKAGYLTGQVICVDGGMAI